MKRSLSFLAALGFALVSTSAFSQSVAYVYVAHNPKNSSTNQVAGYKAGPDGSLRSISGSPFNENVSAMAANGRYLAAVNQSQPDIDVFAIGSGGAPRYVTSANYAKLTSDHECASANQVFFDPSGATLYVQEFNFDCANTGVTSFSVNPRSGTLSYLGADNTGAFPGDNNAAYFTGNDLYAFTAVNSACMYYGVYGFRRKSNGLLVSGGGAMNYPGPGEHVRRYVPDLLAADPWDHLAVLMQPANPPDCASGPLRLATYTVSGSGNLITGSSYINMPATLIVNPTDMKMSPSGRLLAVAGQEGLEIFHFNGARPVTRDTGLLTSEPITQMFWDKSNHLYAISQAAGKLYVFTVTPGHAAPAPGSPHAIEHPENLAVQPLTVEP